MSKFQMLYLKVLNGEACCLLESEAGKGCNFGCPYAGVKNCESTLKSDKRRLYNIMKKLDELTNESNTITPHKDSCYTQVAVETFSGR